MRIKFWGGFHNTPPVNVEARVIADGQGETAWLSPGQQTRLARRFCGLRGCGCGGARRAAFSLPPGWRFIGSLGHYGLVDSMIAYRPEPGQQFSLSLQGDQS
jgi:hypothetical protein